MSKHIQIHILQDMLPGNPNRGENGEPKSALYGGVRRARISSQAQKYAMRNDERNWIVEETGDQREVVRTRHLVSKRIPELLDEELSKDQVKLLKTVVDDLYGGDDTIILEDKAVLILIGEQVLGGALPNDIVKAVNALPLPPDIALYGRMITGKRGRGVDAALHMSHSLSVNPVETDIDWFTAMDDLTGDEPGAAHLNPSEFQSGLMYRYALINVGQLLANLGDDAELSAATIRGAVQALLMASPNGHRTQYGTYSLPRLALVTVGYDAPVNLMGAYEKPIRSRNGYLQPAIEALKEHYQNLADSYGYEDEVIWSSLGDVVDGQPGEPVKFKDLAGRILEIVQEAV